MHLIAKVNLHAKDDACAYSKIGMATLGLVLEEVYDEEYAVHLKLYLTEDKGLSHTKLPDETMTLENA